VRSGNLGAVQKELGALCESRLVNKTQCRIHPCIELGLRGAANEAGRASQESGETVDRETLFPSVRTGLASLIGGVESRPLHC
jgi:hypothetical protein